MHNKTMSWNENWIIIFICFVGSLLLSASSSSLFKTTQFLIQILRWIRVSSRIDSIIFLIAWGIFLEWWELDPQFIPSSSSLLMSQASSSSQIQLKVITSFWHAFLTWMNPMILGGHSRWPSPLLHYSLSASSCSLIWETLVKYECMVSAFWIFTFFTCFLKVIFWFMFFPWNSLAKESNIFDVFGETLVVQVDPWLNQPWSSWPWPSSSCVRLLASSPSGTRTSLLM